VIVQSIRHWITHNWLLKIFSLILATMLWLIVAREASSEVGLEVPLEYRNIPRDLEITGDTTNLVEVRLRGPSNVLKEITARNVVTTIDLAEMRTGEKIVALSPQNVQAPFGAEVIRVNPSSVRFSLEKTVSKTVPITPAIVGQPADGYEVERVVADPATVQVEGPESRLKDLSSIATVPIRVEGKQARIEQASDLDVPDPQIRLLHPSTISIRIEIHRRDHR
jgi:YbbR domain-containing protein